MDRLFLDANVLFSAAYRIDSGLRVFWELADVELVTSSYALEEARRNLDTNERTTRLEELARAIEVLPEPLVQELPSDVELAEKDRPILAAALQSGSSHLITGDRQHFGHHFGKSIGCVLVMRPGDYLAGRRQ